MFEEFDTVKEKIDVFTNTVNKNLLNKLNLTRKTYTDYKTKIESLTREENDLTKELSQLKIYNDQLNKEYAQLQRNNKEIKSKIDEYESQWKTLQVQEQLLQKDLQRAETLLSKEKQRQLKLKEKVIKRKEMKIKKVSIYENLLGLKIESNKWKDANSDRNQDRGTPPQVIFTFNKFDETDLNRECKIILETSLNENEEPFKIVDSIPKLRNIEDHTLLLDTLKQPDGLRNFIIQSRKLLIEALKNEKSDQQSESEI
ncbi:uncharacterized protein PWA37_002786 [Arxiozyma heterogenica]|uniref:uncharacterized protein n=1 Tax=Arxiozyma heterogenica TaxID=278026 RepID=UPI002EE82DF9